MLSVESSQFQAHVFHEPHLHRPTPNFQSRRKTTSSDGSDSDPDEISQRKEPRPAEDRRAYERWQLLQAYETEFNKRPKGLGQKAAWLLDLAKNNCAMNRNGTRDFSNSIKKNYDMVPNMISHVWIPFLSCFARLPQQKIEWSPSPRS